MRIPLLYRGEYSQWSERFMNYLEEQTDGEAMTNSIKNGDQPLPRVTQVLIAGTSSTKQPPLKDKSMWSDQEKKIQKIINKNLMDINIDALYNILKQNQGDNNDAMGSKKKTIVVTSDPLALIAEKTKVNKRKEKFVVSSDSEGSDEDDFSELKKITALKQIDDQEILFDKMSRPLVEMDENIVQICLRIIDLKCSKHMMGNRALLTNFMEKFLGTVRFGNNDFAVIAGYGDVVIGSMTIKRVYYVEGLDLLTDDRSSNLYTIALNEIASNFSSCLLAKASSSQSLLWHQRLSRLNFTIINNLMKNNLVRDEASKVIISFIKKTQVSLQLQVERVRIDNGTEFKNKTLATFFDELKKYLTTNVETSNNEEEVFHEVSESFQRKSSSSSINDDVQSSEEVIVPQTNTLLISNDMIPNVNDVSSSHNVFNERLEDTYFDTSTVFYDTSNVHEFYQPYPHDQKWTKDHPLHKIIGDPKSSVRTMGQLGNSCMFACLLSSIEPANVAEALKDADWVIAMQE
nr:hypothetical protein [Tanacetum cinerariifolium]